MSSGGLDDLAKSMVRFVWALSVFGADRLMNALSSSGATRPTAEPAIGLGLGTFTPRGATRLTLDLLRRSAGVLDFLSPAGEGPAPGSQLRNRLEAFTLFAFVDGVLALDGRAALDSMVEAAAALEPFRSVWAMEGVGHYYTERLWARQREPTGMLGGDEALALPERSLVPLHAGMGLSLAARALSGVRADAGDDVLRQALCWFVGLCRRNSRAGYVGAAYEALGLVARNLYPQLIAIIDRLLAERERDDLVGYFWHGVGRALYFAPTNSLPFIQSNRRLVDEATREPPRPSAVRNALAGLAWAMTLVNIRQPEVLEAFLPALAGGGLDLDAFGDGVGCAAQVWRHAAPQDPALDTFCRYLPSGADPGTARLWNEVVSEPCTRAMLMAIPPEGLGDLFHHRCERWALQ